MNCVLSGERQMNEHSRTNDSRIVVKFPALEKKLWNSTQRKNKSWTKEACTPCSVLLLNLDTPLKSSKSLQELEEQCAVCVKKCLKRRVSKNSKIIDSCHLSKTAREENFPSDLGECEIMIKGEPPSPQPNPTDITSSDKNTLSQLSQNGRQIHTRNWDHNEQITVKVKVEPVEPGYKDASYKINENKRRGVNRNFLIKDSAEKFSLDAPTQPRRKTADTKLGPVDSTDPSQQLNSRTAVVQPRMSSKNPTLNPVTKVQTPTIPTASSNLSKQRENRSILPQVCSVEQMPASASENLGRGHGEFWRSLASTSSAEHASGVVNVDMSKLLSSGTSSVVKAVDQSNVPPTPPSNVPPTPQPLASSKDGMCILQLMNGQMVLLPIDTVRQLSANISSPLIQTSASANVVNIPTIYSLNPGTADPFTSPMVQPGITYLAPTAPNLVTPTVMPQVCNFTPGIVGQQSITNPIVYIPQTSITNTTLLCQQNGKQANIISTPNIVPSSVQSPSMLPLAQQQLYSVLSAPKPVTPTANTKPISNTSYLRLADGQLVPIINDSAILGTNQPSSTTIKRENGGVTTVSFSSHSGLPITNSVISTSVPPTVNPIQYVPLAPPPPPPPINGAVNPGSPRFLQFPNGSLVPIVNQNISKANNRTPVILQTNANVPVQQTPSVQRNPTSDAMTASDLVKKHIQNSKMRIIRPAQTQLAPQNVKMTSIQGAQQPHAVNENTNQSGPRFQESIFQILNTRTDLFQSEDTPKETTSGLLKKSAPPILNSNKTNQTNETSIDPNKPASGPNTSPHTARNKNVVSFYAMAPKPTPSLLVPAVKPVSAPTKNDGEPNPTKTGSKRKSVNIVREDFDARKKTKGRGAPKPSGRTYFTQEVIDVDEEEERKKMAGEDGQPQYMFMRSVSKPEFRPVFLDSTIEEKGLRLPDSMLI